MQPEILFPHTAIYTPNLDASLAFYRAFFGVEPKKIKPKYAKFELLNPRWNFTLNESPALAATSAQTLSHLGFQVASSAEVKAIQARLLESGVVPALEEIGSTCCYAVQDKFWVKSPEGIDWEIFTVLADADVFRDNTPNETTESAESMCCSPAVAPAAPIQLTIPVAQP
ncbi:MAG: ArsI/CadI family heavy metal resistance metalloenzyme [Chlorobiales bacterium]